MMRLLVPGAAAPPDRALDRASMPLREVAGKRAEMVPAAGVWAASSAELGSSGCAVSRVIHGWIHRVAAGQ